MRETAPRLELAILNGAKVTASRAHEGVPKIDRTAADKGVRNTRKIKRKDNKRRAQKQDRQSCEPRACSW